MKKLLLTLALILCLPVHALNVQVVKTELTAEQDKQVSIIYSLAALIISCFTIIPVRAMNEFKKEKALVNGFFKDPSIIIDYSPASKDLEIEGNKIVKVSNLYIERVEHNYRYMVPLAKVSIGLIALITGGFLTGAAVHYKRYKVKQTDKREHHA